MERPGLRWYQLTVSGRLVSYTLFQCDSRSMLDHGAKTPRLSPSGAGDSSQSRSVVLASPSLVPGIIRMFLRFRTPDFLYESVTFRDDSFANVSWRNQATKPKTYR